MTGRAVETTRPPASTLRALSGGEREEMAALGVLSPQGEVLPAPRAPQDGAAPRPIERRAIEAASVLNEAYDYPRPSSFARGIRFDLGDNRMRAFYSIRTEADYDAWLREEEASLLGQGPA